MPLIPHQSTATVSLRLPSICPAFGPSIADAVLSFCLRQNDAKGAIEPAGGRGLPVVNS